MSASTAGPGLLANLINLSAIGLPTEPTSSVLNLLAALALLVGMDWSLRNASVPAWLRAVALLGMSLTLPLPWLITMDTEHVVHAAGCVWFLLAMRHHGERRWRLTAIVLAVVLPLVQLQSLLLIAAAAMVTAMRSRRDAAVLAIAGLSLTSVLVLVSLITGWVSLPISLVQDGRALPLMRLIDPAAWEDWLSLGVVSGMLLALALLHATSSPRLQFGNEAAIVLLTAHFQIMLIGGGFSRDNAFLSGIVTVAYVSSGWEVTTRLWPTRMLTARHVALAVAIILPVLGFLPTRGAARDRFFNLSPVPVADMSRKEFTVVSGAVC